MVEPVSTAKFKITYDQVKQIVEQQLARLGTRVKHVEVSGGEIVIVVDLAQLVLDNLKGGVVKSVSLDSDGIVVEVLVPVGGGVG
jgi:uncharacterized radical SAM superfamily Fe-S cluster-containing enzyme